MYILNTGPTQGGYDRRYPDELSETRTDVGSLFSPGSTEAIEIDMTAT
jgi:hypothetical protein